MPKKIDFKAIIGIATAIIAGVVAFAGEIGSQKKEKRIDNMDARISFLENIYKETKQ